MSYVTKQFNHKKMLIHNKHTFKVQLQLYKYINTVYFLITFCSCHKLYMFHIIIF